MSIHSRSFASGRGARAGQERLRINQAIPARSELHGLTSQINRATVSVAANLAEGSLRTSRKDQAHFSQIGYGSLMELACLLILAGDLEFIAVEQEMKVRETVESVSRQINALRNSQVNS